jgi:hypothetical protein
MTTNKRGYRFVLAAMLAGSCSGDRQDNGPSAGAADTVGSCDDATNKNGICTDSPNGPTRFRDHSDQLPASYLNRSNPKPIQFKLSQGYPTSLFAIKDAVLDTWGGRERTDGQREVDFQTDTDRYLFALRTYFFKGLKIWLPDPNDPLCKADPDDPHCRVITNPAFNQDARHGDIGVLEKFFNVPFMNDVSHPREGIHGLTEERHPVLADLQPGFDGTPKVGRSYGVAYYNRRGGYVLGQVFRDAQGQPTADADPGHAIFPENAAAMKLLFTTATPTQVKWLKGAFEWEAHLTKDSPKDADIGIVRLIQIDVAVKDARRTHDTNTGWVFGTFVYDPDDKKVTRAAVEFGAPPCDDKPDNPCTPWHHMMPLGVSWGNDPGVKPGDVGVGQPPRAGQRIKETAVAELAPDHAVIDSSQGKLVKFGWAGRMNGPIDNPLSTCMSCHGTAQFHTDCLEQLPPVQPGERDGRFLSQAIVRMFGDDTKLGPSGMELRQRWMRNIHGAEARPPDPTDQLDFTRSTVGDAFDADRLRLDDDATKLHGLDFSLQLQLAIEAARCNAPGAVRRSVVEPDNSDSAE